MDKKQQVAAESLYWYHVVRNYMDDQADWRYLDGATLGLLKGTHNQDYIGDEILWPVERWRQLDKEQNVQTT